MNPRSDRLLLLLDPGTADVEAIRGLTLDDLDDAVTLLRLDLELTRAESSREALALTREVVAEMRAWIRELGDC